jgi:hypothetical protein
VDITTKIKHISSTATENHLITSAIYGGQIRTNNITIEEIRKKQGFTELQSDPLRFQEQELQQKQSVQCGINPRTHLRNLKIINFLSFFIPFITKYFVEYP